jgi:hypothetical protein
MMIRNKRLNMKNMLIAALVSALFLASQSVFAQQAAPAAAQPAQAAPAQAAPAGQQGAPATSNPPPAQAEASGQGVGTVGNADATRMVSDVPQQALKEISVEKFEVEGAWRSYIDSDSGISMSRLFTGGPSAKTPVSDERDFDISDKTVLGTKVDFFRRGFTDILITPLRPIGIEGIVKTVSIWVAGRNYNHTLYLLVQDFNGNTFELLFDNKSPNLNFQGWKQLQVAIPPAPADSKSGIVQRNLHYANRMGLRIVGLRIACDAMDAYGTYYVYFDDMRAVTDLFAETSRDPDDPSDDW